MVSGFDSLLGVPFFSSVENLKLSHARGFSTTKLCKLLFPPSINDENGYYREYSTFIYLVFF